MVLYPGQTNQQCYDSCTFVLIPLSVLHPGCTTVYPTQQNELTNRLGSGTCNGSLLRRD